MEEQAISPAEPKEMNWLARIFNIIFEPRKVFESLKQKPKWFVPLVVVSLVTLVFLYFVSNIMVAEQIAKTELRQPLTEPQKQVMINWIKIASLTMTPISIIAISVLQSLVLFFVFNVLMGGDSTFKRVLSVVSHSYLISIPAIIVRCPLILFKKTMEVQTSLAAFLSVDLKDSIIYKLLGGFDIFALWQVIVLSIGLSVMYNFSFKKSLIPIFIMWIILIVVGALLSMIGHFGGF